MFDFAHRGYLIQTGILICFILFQIFKRRPLLFGHSDVPPKIK